MPRRRMRRTLIRGQRNPAVHNPTRNKQSGMAQTIPDCIIYNDYTICALNHTISSLTSSAYSAGSSMDAPERSRDWKYRSLAYFFAFSLSAP